MVNLLIQNLRYISLQDMKDSSDILKSISDNDIKKYGSRAEKVIDMVLGNKLTDPIASIPLEVKQSVIMLAECMYEHRDNIKGVRIIKSEKRRGNQVTFATEKEDYELQKIDPCLDRRIYNLLKPNSPAPTPTNTTITSKFFR